MQSGNHKENFRSSKEQKLQQSTIFSDQTMGAPEPSVPGERDRQAQVTSSVRGCSGLGFEGKASRAMMMRPRLSSR